MFLGILKHPKTRPLNEWAIPADIKAGLFPDAQPDVFGSYETQTALIVSGERFNTPWSQASRQSPLTRDNVSVAFWGRLDNRVELAAHLNMPGTLAETSDSELVLKGWQTWGKSLPDHLWGDFSIAVLDETNKTLFLSRDRSGVKPLYYWPHADGFLFATTLAAFRRLRFPLPQPSPNWISRYLTGLSSDLYQTAFEDIQKLPAGHSLFVAGGQVHQWEYHQWPTASPTVDTSGKDWVGEYRALLQATIKNHLPSSFPLGVESSGGIDSSTILAHIAQQLPRPSEGVHALGTALFSDEAKHILEASQSAGIAHNYVTTLRNADYDRDPAHMRRSLAALGYPCEHQMATAHTPFYEYCRSQGIRTLFSGFGGDEVVTNYARLVTTELWQAGHYKESLARFSRNVRMPAQILKTIFPDMRHDQQMPLPSEYKSHLAAQHLLTKDAVANLDLASRLQKRRLIERNYRQHNDWIVNGLLKLPSFSTRLENCTLLAAAHGVEYRWPLWDARLIQFYLSTPLSERLGPNGISRFLHRRAITGVVPDNIAWRPSKDMGSALVQNEPDAQRVQQQLGRVVQALPTDLEHVVDIEKISSFAQTLHEQPLNQQLLHQTRKWTRLLQHLTVWCQPPQ